MRETLDHLYFFISLWLLEHSCSIIFSSKSFTVWYNHDCRLLFFIFQINDWTHVFLINHKIIVINAGLAIRLSEVIWRFRLVSVPNRFLPLVFTFVDWHVELIAVWIYTFFETLLLPFFKIWQLIKFLSQSQIILSGNHGKRKVCNTGRLHLNFWICVVIIFLFCCRLWIHIKSHLTIVFDDAFFLLNRL